MDAPFRKGRQQVGQTPPRAGQFRFRDRNDSGLADRLDAEMSSPSPPTTLRSDSMPRKIAKVKSTTRTSRLTPQEIEQRKTARQAAEAEKPEVIAKFRLHQALTKLVTDLKDLREQKSLSLQQVAESVGMDRSNLAKLENGHRENPTLETLFRVAAALGVRVEFTLNTSAGNVISFPPSQPERKHKRTGTHG
jgi:DNA-binding XRE family transcriptional regulator